MNLSKEEYANMKQAKRESIVNANTASLHDILLTGEKWPAFLETLANHPHRSPLNIAAIAASDLAGSKELHTFDEWNELGATIKRGSKGIPVIVKSGKYFDAAVWYGESQVTGAEDRYRGFANKNPQALEEALGSISGHEFLTETEKWIFEKRYGLNEGTLPPVAERELFARELQEASEIGVPEILRDLCKRISALSNTMDIALGKTQVESRYVSFEIPNAFSRDFVGNDQTRLKEITIPPGTTLADGTDIGRYRFVVNESLTVNKDNTVKVSLPKVSSKTEQDWNVTLKRDFGSRDEETGTWVEDIKTVDVPSSTLAQAVTEQRERYLSEQKQQRDQEKKQDAPDDKAQKAKKPDEPSKSASAKRSKGRAKTTEELAARGKAKAAAENAAKSVENPTQAKAEPKL